MSGPENKKPQIPNKPNTSNFLVIIIITLVFFAIFLLMSESPSKVKELSYTEFLSYVDGVYALQKNNETKNTEGINRVKLIKEDEQFKTFMNLDTREIIQVKHNSNEFKIVPLKKIKEIVFKGSKRIEGEYLENTYSTSLADVKGTMVKFITLIPLNDPFLLKKLEEREISVTAKSDESNTTFWSIIYSAIPYLLLFGLIWFLFFRQVQGGNNKAFNFVKSRAKLYKGNLKKIVFGDVAGVDEAKQELNEIVEFLKEPDKFIRMGARIPKGVLLVGPPGTGKTLLAKAVAGEANRPFYSISGSEFVEMFVGVGASRVRDLFETAKKDAPCIIFIDELDAVGRMRGAGLGGGNDEREQTLNQILVEMDGFDNKETIIIIAATNRPDILDQALLRPGRFDRQVVVDLPDLKGRTEILKIHVKTKPISEDVNLETIAKGTPGFSGADLENMVNEATLIAARGNKKLIEMADFEEARDKIMMGPERKSRVLLEKEKTNTAYHEAGHTVVAHFLPDADPIHKVTIIPRGRALGVTQHLPTQDRFTHTKNFLLTQIAILLGGRVTEEYKFGHENITTGASNDIERSTALARSLVCKWGMSEKMGPLTYGKDDSPIFIGKELARYKDYSEHTANEIDDEVKKIIQTQYKLAKEIIEKNKEKMENLVKALLEKETLQQTEIEEILGPRPIKD